MMGRFVILTDSACDLPQELAEKHHIDILCFKLALDGVGYTERVDFTPEEFTELLRHTASIPTTSQVTQYEFFEKFEEYERAGVEEVLYVSINANGSGTNAAAHAAAAQLKEEYPDSKMRIEIVDSHSYSITYGTELCHAAEMRDAGRSLDETVAYLNDRFARLELVLTAYTLGVIRKSGRVSAAAAIAGDLLGIHPVFTLNDGVSRVIKKVRGDRHVLTAMITHVKQHMIPGTPYYIGVTDEKYGELYAKEGEACIGYPPARVFRLGSAVCSNTGPEAAGILFEGPKRERAGDPA